MPKITAILNIFKRPHFLQEQIYALKNQTLRPTEIMIWNNGENHAISIDNYKNLNVTIANSSKNFGVWARFAYALNAKSEYVCVFDDDTIPGNRWLENCYQTIQINEGLLGTAGVIFNTNNYYPYIRVGWPNPNNETKTVDIVGHSWFFKREWLPYFWMESPTEGFDLVGEDMHFSYVLQKYLKLSTYVPPHPTNDKSLWGSLKGMRYGSARNPAAISHYGHNIDKMNEYFQILKSRGFKTIIQ